MTWSGEMKSTSSISWIDCRVALSALETEKPPTVAYTWLILFMTPLLTDLDRTEFMDAPAFRVTMKDPGMTSAFEAAGIILVADPAAIMEARTADFMVAELRCEAGVYMQLLL